MKLFQPFTILLCSAIAGLSACNPARKNERSQPHDKATETFNLLGQHCQSNFKFLPGSVVADEVLPPKPMVFDMEEVKSLLAGEGIVGHMHAAIPEYNTWVFNYQQGSFFNNYQFPMAITDPALLEVAKTLKRHDKVQLNGSIIGNGAAQKHILVTAIKVLVPYENTEIEPNYTHTPAAPKELAEGHSAVVGVHSISTDGMTLTVEYRDFVVQVVVKDPKWTKELYRNDKIKINYQAAVVEGRPLHLILDESTEKPVEVLDRLADLHGRAATAEGCLVLFPQSPQINRDIYALLEIDGNGIIRTWTLANFEDKEVFDAITKKLADYWAERKVGASNFRNKMLNTGIHVTATGTLNITSPNQANPQILISKLDDLSLTD